jgi:hypothetical protein
VESSEVSRHSPDCPWLASDERQLVGTDQAFHNDARPLLYCHSAQEPRHRNPGRLQEAHDYALMAGHCDVIWAAEKLDHTRGRPHEEFGLSPSPSFLRSLTLSALGVNSRSSGVVFPSVLLMNKVVDALRPRCH